MNITPINYNPYQYNYKTQRQNTQPVQPAFTGVGKFTSEKSIQKGEYALRIIANRINDLFQNKKAKEITKIISEIEVTSTKEYLKKLEAVSRWFATKRAIDINTEDKILEEIVKSGKSTIFIMNHSNQSEDPQLLAFLNTLLCKAYLAAGVDEGFPLPKIILNQDILKTMNSTKRRAFEAIGAVGVDANIKSKNTGVNARALYPVMRDFIEDKCNIFIFPEGRLAVRKDLEPFQRFQSGVAEMINKMLGMKKEVRVVPAGFYYGKGEQKNLAGIQIGTPVIFRREKGITTTTAGSIPGSEYACEGFAKFFEKHKGEEHIAITENGKPVDKRNVAEFIKDILSENLEICTKEASQRILKPIDENEIIIV